MNFTGKNHLAQELLLAAAQNKREARKTSRYLEVRFAQLESSVRHLRAFHPTRINPLNGGPEWVKTRVFNNLLTRRIEHPSTGPRGFSVAFAKRGPCLQIPSVLPNREQKTYPETQMEEELELAFGQDENTFLAGSAVWTGSNTLSIWLQEEAAWVGSLEVFQEKCLRLVQIQVQNQAKPPTKGFLISWFLWKINLALVF